MPSLIPLPYADLHAHDRASAGWFFDPAGALVQVAANAARVDYDPATLAARGLLVEEAATNGVQNPRCEGAVVGTPGTRPTGWGFIGGSGGIPQQIAGVGVEDGIPYVDVRFAGTPSASGSCQILFGSQGINNPAAVVGQTWQGQFRARLGGGSLANVSTVQGLINEYNAGSFLSGTFPTFTLAAGALRSGVVPVSRVLASATVNNIGLGFQAGITSGLPIDFTVRVAAPQLWQSALSFSPSFPPIGTPGPSARAADRVTRTLGHRFSRSAFTMLTRGLFAQAAPAGMTRGVLQIDDGTNANRIRVENTPGGSALRLVVTTGGVDTATLALGSMTPGTPFGVAFACADGDIAAVRNGGTIQTAAVAVPPGLAFMRVGAVGFDHANLMNGWIRAHRLMRGRLDNDALITMAA